VEGVSELERQIGGVEKEMKALKAPIASGIDSPERFSLFRRRKYYYVIL